MHRYIALSLVCLLAICIPHSTAEKPEVGRYMVVPVNNQWSWRLDTATGQVCRITPSGSNTLKPAGPPPHTPGRYAFCPSSRGEWRWVVDTLNGDHWLLSKDGAEPWPGDRSSATNQVWQGDQD